MTTLAQKSNAQWHAFNINHKVRVRLTDFGRRCHKANWETFWNNIRSVSPRPYEPPIEVDGWSEWQLWVLMEEFGQHLHAGGLACFENNIIEWEDRS